MGTNTIQTSRIIPKLFRNSLITVIVAVIATMIGIVIDGIVISRFLGADSMAAYGLITPVVNATGIFSGVLTTGTQVVCAQHCGAGNAGKARRVFSMCMIATIVISVVILTCTLLFKTQIATFLGARGASSHLLPYAVDYLSGISISLPMTIFLFEFSTLMRMDGDTVRVIVAVAAMTIADISGDLLNVFVFKGGMFGMGLATSVSYLIAGVILVLHFTRKDIIFKPTVRGLKLKDLKDILVTGSSSAVGSASGAARNTLLNRIMVSTTLSAAAVSALSIMNTVLGFASCTMIGIGMTTSMVAGMILGDRDRTAAEQLVKISLKTCLAIGLPLSALIFIFAEPLARVFISGSDTSLVPLAARALRFYSLSITLYGINNTFVNYTQGMRRMGISNVFCFLQNFLFVALPALLLAGRLDTDAVWSAYIIGEVLTLLTMIITAAVRSGRVPYHASDYLFLKEPFTAPAEEIYEVSVNDKSCITDISRDVYNFCESRSADKRRCTLISLFVEELGNNVVSHGFKGAADKNLDIRVVHTEDGWIMRLRDNCRAFDPTSWIKLHSSGDPAANIGIRMVCGMAEDIRYLSTMDLNVLTIKL